MTNTSELDEPVLTGRQTIWIAITVGWIGVSLFQFVDDSPLLGVGGLLVAVLSAYRIARPG